MSYETFLATKSCVAPCAGLEIDESRINTTLFEFQRKLVWWALRKGRCAIFADTGLGKTFMQLEWARIVAEETGLPVLILAPLSVAQQTIREAVTLGLTVHYTRDGSLPGALNITNYEMAHVFSADDIGAVVLDESSILKAVDGKTRRALTEQFSNTDFRLCCTATPAPNDITEIGNHADFLGVMPREQMLGTFFVNNSSDKVHGGWRLKGHAEQAFFRWLASWGMAVRKPSDIGFSDDGYDLPELEINPVFVETDYKPDGEMFFTQLRGIQERSAVRKYTLADRVEKAVDLAQGDEQWIMWHALNDEGECLKIALGDDAVLVQGSDSLESKIAGIESFLRGETRVLVTKPRIAGFGMNFQHCHNMAFVGLGDSWESYYQCIRRCWRFGQTKPVRVEIVLSDPERAIYANVMRKERESQRMATELVDHVREYEKEEIGSAMSKRADYATDEVREEDFFAMLGDSTERLAEVEDASVDLSIFSPPFATLFSYSDSERDMGNSKDYGEFFEHWAFMVQELARVMKPGRNVCVHCQQLPLTKIYDGRMGMRDFRGDLIRSMDGHGFTYHGEVCIDKDPQAQAIRTKAKGLMFTTKNRDSSDLRMAYADYIVIFKRDGENDVPVKSDVTNDEWIQWARPIWYGIKETETLNFRGAREEKDEKHICPLQLETIERCVRLWTNPGDLVLSPFMGIGSEGYVAIQHGRRFVGCELKRSYYDLAVKNLRAAIRERVSAGAGQFEFMSEVS